MLPPYVVLISLQPYGVLQHNCHFNENIFAFYINMALVDQEIAHSDTYMNKIPTPEPPSSSPPRLLGSRGSDKPKRKPTVTPRTFTRFFTPRPSLGRGRKIGASRQILRDITESASNRRGGSRPRTQSNDKVQTLEDDHDGFLDISKKRKRRESISPETTPDLSSPLKRMRSQSFETPQNIVNDGEWDIDHASCEELTDRLKDETQASKHVISRSRGPSSIAFSRELGEFHRTRRPRRPFNGNIRAQSSLYLVADPWFCRLAKRNLKLLQRAPRFTCLQSCRRSRKRCNAFLHHQLQ